MLCDILLTVRVVSTTGDPSRGIITEMLSDDRLIN